MKSKYYDGTKLLSLNDINGNKPEIYLCTTNRTGGKTTYFGRLVVNRFIKSGKKFGLIYRFNYELDDVADKFFKDLSTLFFNGAIMRSKKRAKGLFHELYLDDEHCGYALSLNSSDQLKKYSHLFSDINSLIFDEFQSENNKYCPNEISKLISLHTSIARGQGKQVRYVPIYMLSNAVSLINPYYTTLGISERLNKETKLLRGDGFVLEQGFVETASKSQKLSGFNRAFAKEKYIAYSAENIYLNDSQTFIEKPIGKFRYLATLKFDNVYYSIKEYADNGILYCDNKGDTSFPLKISITTKDHDINYIMLKKNDVFIGMLRYYFEHGCFRFKDLKCKECIMKLLSY